MKKIVIPLVAAGMVVLAGCGGANTTIKPTSTEEQIIDVSQNIYESEHAVIEFYGLTGNKELEEATEMTIGTDNTIYLMFGVGNTSEDVEELRVYCTDLEIDNKKVKSDGVMRIPKGEVYTDAITISKDDLSVDNLLDIQYVGFSLRLVNESGLLIEDTEFKTYEFKDGLLVGQYES